MITIERSAIALQKTLILDFKDLRYFTIECKACHTRVTFDAVVSNSRIPGACPSYANPFDATSVQGPLGQFKDIYRMLCGLEHRITVQVLMNSDD